MTAAERVVRVRWARGVFTSQPMDAGQADELAEAVSALAESCGDTTRFFEFAAWHGTVRVRGRDVVAVEVRAPELARGGYVGTATSGHVVGSIEFHGAPPATGTDYLRQHAYLDRSPAGQR